MEKLNFYTENGVLAYSHEWAAEESEYDAFGWVEEYGRKVGRGVVPLPTKGWIDLRQFAVVHGRKSND